MTGNHQSMRLLVMQCRSCQEPEQLEQPVNRANKVKGDKSASNQEWRIVKSFKMTMRCQGMDTCLVSSLRCYVGCLLALCINFRAKQSCDNVGNMPNIIMLIFDLYSIVYLFWLNSVSLSHSPETASCPAGTPQWNIWCSHLATPL